MSVMQNIIKEVIEMENISYALNAGLLIILIYIWMLKNSYKEQNIFLQKLNNQLTEDVSNFKTKNIKLWFEIKNLEIVTDEQRMIIDDLIIEKDIHEFPVGAKVTWIDRSGETEFGIVIDDSRVDGKLFVHLRKLKNNKPSGPIFTTLADKLKIVE